MMNFVLVDNGDTFRTGEITTTVAEEYFLVQFDNMSGKGLPLPAEMVHLSEMCEPVEVGYKSWNFFPTAKARKAWMDYMSEPSEDAKPKIVSINKRAPAVEA